MNRYEFVIMLGIAGFILVIGTALMNYINTPPEECFLRIAVMGDGDLVSDLDCSKFWDAFNTERGATANYCKQEAQNVVGAAFTVYDCFQTCCITDGGCPGCVATHACFCKAKKGAGK